MVMYTLSLTMVFLSGSGSLNVVFSDLFSDLLSHYDWILQCFTTFICASLMKYLCAVLGCISYLKWKKRGIIELIKLKCTIWNVLLGIVYANTVCLILTVFVEIKHWERRCGLCDCIYLFNKIIFILQNLGSKLSTLLLKR